uniref:Autophagy-related protein 6 n=1 Tax=Setaria digitata TaxID=48799 RepID=A0A915PIL1_9BILA
MGDNVPTCFNCQNKLALDESVFESFDDQENPFLMDTQDDSALCFQEGPSATTGNLYDIICNSNSALKGPMCEDCTEQLLSGMDQHLKELDEECAQYRELLDSLKERSDTRLMDTNIVNAKLVAMKNEEASLLGESKKLEAEEAKLDAELKKKRNELYAENESAELLWRVFRDNHRQLIKMEMKEQDLEAEVHCLKSQRDRLSKINVLNTAFHIWKQGSFGTINGFRLGQLPHSQVEWSEINAAWGQVALLLNTLADCLEVQFTLYRIVPVGSHSFVQCLDTGAELPLFGSGGFKPFGQKKFDEGICAFMECFCQLQRHIERAQVKMLYFVITRLSSLQFRFPHRMYREHIEDNKMEYSVKMQFNAEERWTKAMKCLLINFRWAISYVVHSKILRSEIAFS